MESLVASSSQYLNTSYYCSSSLCDYPYDNTSRIKYSRILGTLAAHSETTGWSRKYDIWNASSTVGVYGRNNQPSCSTMVTMGTLHLHVWL